MITLALGWGTPIFLLASMGEPQSSPVATTAVETPIPEASTPALEAVQSSPQPEAKTFGFDQALTRVHAAYADADFFAQWELNDNQLELTRRDDACDLRAWQTPGHNGLEGLQVNFRQSTPECLDALELAVKTLAPDVDFAEIQSRISDFSKFVEEVDAVDAVTLANGNTKIEAIWVDNLSFCPVGSCDLSIQFEPGNGSSVSSPSNQPEEEVEAELASNPFNFPRATCGDSSSGSDDTWYPVFVDGGNLESIRSSYCADAVATKREDTGVETVQLASFTDRSRAEEFASAVKGEVGQPSLPEEPEAPAARQAPAEVVSSAEQGCDPSYPGICIPPDEGDLNCGDIPHRRFQVLPPDPHGFDREGDGIGCES
ncbi:hypothetical protein [Leptolyngbya sp. FACHB-671]|uniref:hypothetical protein n=1 Tax=Leptolyngbya sp. FACHB-671 TaxID=2692812 RepID=UPI0018F05666|nr:hypothetical protein [Leptolyngbya sp. FACHB-671]